MVEINWYRKQMSGIILLMDEEFDNLKSVIYKTLEKTMPLESIKTRLEDSFKLYDELKNEIREWQIQGCKLI